MERWLRLRPWLLWGLTLTLVTALLVTFRGQGGSYYPLPFLLVVLGGSATAGRKLGFTLAGASFLIMDYLIQAPYYRLFSFGRLEDLVTLVAFFVTAAVASELLQRLRRERDRAEIYAEEVAALSREREHLFAEAEKMKAVREAERLKEFVLASVSHDLRTPLTTIKALAQEEQRTGESHAAGIEEQADRLSRLVGDLLDLSRLRSGTFPVAPELNAAEDVIGAAIRQCEGLLDGRRVVAAVDETAPALYGTFDFVLTLRILNNLLGNALRFTPSGGEVEIAVRQEGALLVFSVADRGPGISAREREHVFKPFYRPEGSPPDRGRVGLGLAIGRTLAEAQGGTLRYRDRDGGGSVLELTLPAASPCPAVLVESL
jgi:K+-sensing histidine kinase KdpD